MMERTTIRLGRKSLVTLVEYLHSNKSWADLNHFLIKHNLNERFSGSPTLSALWNVFLPLVEGTEDEGEMVRAREAFEELTKSWYQTIKAYDEEASKVIEI